MMAFGAKPGSKEDQDRQDVVDQPLPRAVGRSEPVGGPESRRPVQPVDDGVGGSGGK